ncbi:Swi5-domain-containing protein [Polychytrium aggregatum]|uniref:Swi5-domain-containing protein n=1 Tax=Polychytrium aggregatum TaxID=110093 RepID=UPI0022FE3112|nr:Swi5-domain-containing protein [Polychytrium aggregatum]KAI9206481.1 Swi5-domain-containing protein [Polychytrium aggregatum]
MANALETELIDRLADLNCPQTDDQIIELLGKNGSNTTTDSDFKNALGVLLEQNRISRKEIVPGLSLVWMSPDQRKLHHQEKLLSAQLARLNVEKDQLATENASLKAKLPSGLDHESCVQTRIQKLHDYNDVKDYGQMLLGKLAQIEGVTTRQMYEQYELDVDD